MLAEAVSMRSLAITSAGCNVIVLCAVLIYESLSVVSSSMTYILSFRILSVPYFRPQFRSAPFREIVPARKLRHS